MKKKILLVLLVVLMVGILAFSVFACNDKNKKDPDKNPVTNTPVEPDEPIDDTDYLGEALDAVVTAIDNTLANVNDIDTAASVSADIVVKVAVGTETYDVSLKIKGSIDSNEGAAAKNWAQIDADVLGVKVSLFAMNDGSKETLYVAQNVLNENVKWNKLSQFEQANVLSGLACGSILDLVKGIDDETADSLEAGLVNGYAGEILPMVSMVGSLFQPAEGAGNDFATESGYGIGLNINELGKLLPTILKLIGGLDLGDATGLVNTIGGIVLGGTLDLGAGSFVPGAHVPTVEIGVGVENELFTGLSLKYAGKIALEEGADPTDIAINFGIENLSLSGASKSYTLPFTGTPDELAIALDLDLTVPGLVEDVVAAEIAIYPNVKMTFDNDGYVALDLSGLYAVATADIAGENYTIAEYNLNPEYPEDLFIDLGPIINAINEDASADLRTGVYPINDVTVFRVPVDLQAKFDAMIAEQKAPKTEGAAQNAIEGNVVDHVVDNIIPTLFDAEGNFQIGALLGVVGQLGDIVDAITPILETEGLFDYAIDADDATANATINLEVLMDALLVEDGIIDGITGEWNNFDLYNAEGTKENFKLSDILKEADVLENVVMFVNTLIYEGYVENFVPAEEGEEALSYVDYFASENAPAQLTENMVVLAIKQLAGATVVADEFYTGLEATVSGYAQNGIGAGLELAIADGKLGIGIGAKIITNVAKTAETYPAIYYMGDQNGYAMVDQQGTVSNIKVSSNTGYDGGKLLAETLLLIAQGACSLVDTYVDQNVYGIAPEGGTYETAVATTTGGEFQCPRSMMQGNYYIAVTTTGAATITLTCDAEMQAVQYAGLAELNPRNGQWGVMNPVIGLCGEYNEETYETEYVASGVIEVTEAGTYVILVQYYGAPVVGVAIANA